MKPLLINLQSDLLLEEKLCAALDAEQGKMELRRFPDEETYLRVLSDCQQRHVVILCNLYQPDNKILRLILLADTLREMGAAKIGLITPYLAYMRQDKRFHDGECVSSKPFAKLISQHLDFMVTMDPHLHRYHSLSEIYTIPATAVHAAALIAAWIEQHIDTPLLIGPDSESEQWVSQVAKLAGAPCQVLSKIRRGDYDVEVTLPDVEQWRNHTPVLVDDIISSGRTMLETIEHLNKAGMPRVTCIAVHGIFAGDAYQQLSATADVVTTACITHPSNHIDISKALAQATLALLE
ncbi:MAG: ribose-phosphate pyrophosphokinase [Amphritea sp.]